MTKKEYMKSFLISIAEEESLYWLYKNEVENQFISLLDLKKIIFYLLNKNIMQLNSYENDVKRILENPNNWKDRSQKYITNLTKVGFDYFENKRYYEEIDNGIFPNFEMIKLGK